jgi:phosphoglycerol transferase MdoB-like AlkP superfamily enzyme
MKALALFCVLVVAKLLAVAGRDLPLSGWTPLALFWQDALVALVFAVVDFVLRKKPVVSWSLFWLIAGYVAVNVALTRVLSSPLTWQMSHAAGGALTDSIRHYLTPGNLALMATVMLSAAVFAAASSRLRPIPARLRLGTLAALALAGAFAAQQADCGGLHRNALVAFVDSALPQVRSRPATSPNDWRATPPDNKTAEDLTWLRGAAPGRNVVLIALESTGARSLRCYGAKEDPTPNLTRLAETSLLFENAYSVYPESIKGLFSVLCSRYPAFDTRAEDYARIRTPSLAEVLAGEGCRTALFHSGRFMYLGMNAVIQRRGFETLEDAGAISGNFNSSFGVDEPATVERMLSWIDALPRGQRFFLYYLPIAGHHPYATPERGPFRESDDAGQYLNALHFGDAALGKFLDGLKARRLDTNTLFMIYGDHGEAFGQHEGNYGHTLFLYEENVHVPLLVTLPGAWRAATRVRRTASLIDIAPTLLDLLGLRAPADYQGATLLEPRQRAALFFTDYSLPLAGVCDGRWKVITEVASSRVKLFDLETDPHEARNVAGRYPKRVTDWRRCLDEWTAAQKAMVLRPDCVARSEATP